MMLLRLYQGINVLREANMKTIKKHIDPCKFGTPLEDHIAEQMKDPGYRRTYLVSRVRVAIAALIKVLREQAGMSQAQLAKRAGIPQSQIARLEGTNDKRIPSMDFLTKIFAALDCRAFLDIVPKQENTEKREIVLV